MLPPRHQPSPTKTLIASTPLGKITISFVRGENPKLEIAPLRDPFGLEGKVVTAKEGHVVSDRRGYRIRAVEEEGRRKASFAQKVEDDIRGGRFDG